jgi:hypothetical protein
MVIRGDCESPGLHDRNDLKVEVRGCLVIRPFPAASSWSLNRTAYRIIQCGWCYFERCGAAHIPEPTGPPMVRLESPTVHGVAQIYIDHRMRGKAGNAAPWMHLEAKPNACRDHGADADATDRGPHIKAMNASGFALPAFAQHLQRSIDVAEIDRLAALLGAQDAGSGQAWKLFQCQRERGAG